MTMPINAQSIFQQLRSDQRHSTQHSVLSRPSGVFSDKGVVRFALGASREPLLLLPVDVAQFLPDIQTSNALRLRLDTVTFEGVQSRFLELACLDTALESVFSDVCDSLINRIKDGESVNVALTQTMEQFARLFLVQNVHGPSCELVQGLLGELLFLEELVIIDPRAALVWTGPLGRPHDFRCGNQAVEIKSLSRASPWQIEITSLDQLAIPNGGALHLRVSVLSQDPVGSLTVNSLVKKIEGHTGYSQVMRERLAALGCDSPDDPAWNKFSFSLESHTYYSVDNSFPALTGDRIRDAGLAAGIIGARYTINLSSAGTQAIDSDAVRELILSLLRGLDSV